MGKRFSILDSCERFSCVVEVGKFTVGIRIITSEMFAVVVDAGGFSYNVCLTSDIQEAKETAKALMNFVPNGRNDMFEVEPPSIQISALDLLDELDAEITQQTHVKQVIRHA